MTKMHKNISSIGWFFWDKRAKMVCLHRRDNNALEGKNTWDYFGGAVEKYDRTPENALTRELKEELGMTFKRNKIKLISSLGRRNIYVIFNSVHNIQKIKLKEGSGFAWLFIDYIIKYLENISLDAHRQLKRLYSGLI